MTGVWQDVQGNYLPLEVFERDDKIVVTKEVVSVGGGIYQWKEFSIKKEDYEAVNGAITKTQESVNTNTTDISDNRDGLMETFEANITNSDDITTLRDGLMEVYEMLLESEV